MIKTPTKKDGKSSSSELPAFIAHQKQTTIVMRQLKSVRTRSRTVQQNDQLVGAVLGGKFIILDIIGKGSMAVVYLGRHLHLDKLVAIKVLRTDDGDIRRRFAREVEAHCRLKHDNIVEAIDVVDVPDRQTFFIMEYLEGMNLKELLEVHGRLEREDEAASILTQVCDALTHAHARGIIHRDLKPDNIVLVERDGELIAKVVDFGLAKVEGAIQQLTQAGQTLGSPLYMSSEQCQGFELTPASDVYSLGVVAYETITGKVPFSGAHVMEVMSAHCDPQLKPAKLSTHNLNFQGLAQLEQILFKALEKEPEKRFQSAEDFKKALASWMRSIGLSHAVREIESGKSTLMAGRAYRPDELKTSIYNIVSTRQKEASLERVTILNSTKELSKKLKLGKHAGFFKLGITAGFAVLLTILLAGFIIQNSENIGSWWKESSINLSRLFKKHEPNNQSQPVIDETPEETKSGGRLEEEPSVRRDPEPPGKKERRYDNLPEDGDNVRRL